MYIYLCRYEDGLVAMVNVPNGFTIMKTSLHYVQNTSIKYMCVMCRCCSAYSTV
jgi:hypothetical protein